MANWSDFFDTPYTGAFGTGTPQEEGTRKPAYSDDDVAKFFSMQRPDTSQENVRYTTASPLVSITDQDIALIPFEDWAPYEDEIARVFVDFMHSVGMRRTG